jgi:protein SCO1/2
MSNLSRLRWLFLGLNFVLIVLLFTARGLKAGPFAEPSAPLPVYAEVPEFSLNDETGATFGRENLLGKVWVADFIFTRCAGICPLMSAHTQKLQKDMPFAHFVSFTTDPAYDSPQVLAAYAKNYGAEPGRWVFLTGAKETLDRIAVAFKMNKLDEPMMHSGSFVLIDREGKVRGFYNSDDTERLSALRKDALALSRG